MSAELLWINPSSSTAQKISSALCASLCHGSSSSLLGTMLKHPKNLLDLHTGMGRDYGSGHHYGGKLMDIKGRTSWFPNVGVKLTPKSHHRGSLLWKRSSPLIDKAKAVARSISQAKPTQLIAEKSKKIVRKGVRDYREFKSKPVISKIGLGAATGATASVVFSMLDNFPSVMNGDMKKYFCVVLRDAVRGAVVGATLAGMYVFCPTLATGATITLLFVPLSCCVMNYGVFGRKTIKKILMGLSGLLSATAVVMLGFGAIPAAAIGSFTTYMVRELCNGGCPAINWSQYRYAQIKLEQ